MIYFESDSPMEVSRSREYPPSTGSFMTEREDSVDFTAYLEDGRICKHCGEEIAEYIDGWKHNNTDNIYCDEDEDLSHMDDLEKSEFLTQEGYWVDETQTLESSLEDWERGHDKAEPVPAAPGNWVGITVNPEAGETQVQMSVGDPRGCFIFGLWTYKDPTTGEEELRLSLPYPEMGQSHMILTHIADGTYRVT